MNLEIYSDRAKQAVQSAQSLALSRRHQQLKPEHLLKVLLEERDGLARQLITNAGGRMNGVAADVDLSLNKLPRVEGGNGQIYLGPDTARVFARAEEDAKKAGDQFVTTERLLSAIAADGGEAVNLLKKTGVTPAGLDAAIGSMRKGKTADSAGAED